MMKKHRGFGTDFFKKAGFFPGFLQMCRYLACFEGKKAPFWNK